MSRTEASECGGTTERTEVRVPPPDDAGKNVTLDVAVGEATIAVRVKGFRLRLSRSAAGGIARGGLLVAVAAVLCARLSGQRMTILVVAIAIAPAVLWGPGALGRRRNRARS